MVCSPRKDLNSLLVLQNMFIKNFQIFVNVRGSEWSYDTLGEGQASKSLLKWGGGGVDPLRYFPVSIFAHSNCGIWGGCWWTLGQPKASPVNVYGRGGGIIGQHASIRASHHDIAYRHVAYQRDTLSSNYYHYLLPNLRWISFLQKTIFLIDFTFSLSSRAEWRRELYGIPQQFHRNLVCFIPICDRSVWSIVSMVLSHSWY